MPFPILHSISKYSLSVTKPPKAVVGVVVVVVKASAWVVFVTFGAAVVEVSAMALIEFEKSRIVKIADAAETR